MTQNNLELMWTLDGSRNAQDWGTFEKRHSKDTTVFWPGWAEPTRGRNNHKAESVEFFKTFPDNHRINHPYKIEIAQGEWTCTVADFTSTMRGPMKGSDGNLIMPANKKFHIEFCTVAHWKNGEIVEENLFYDLVGLLKQMPSCDDWSPAVTSESGCPCTTFQANELVTCQRSHYRWALPQLQAVLSGAGTCIRSSLKHPIGRN